MLKRKQEDSNVLVVGITGRSGSGKSKLTAYYASLGYHVLDGDELSREINMPGSPCLQELIRAFGPEIVAEDGTLLRAKLAEIAFSTSDGVQRLNDITHPHLLRETLRRIELARQQGAVLFFIDGAAIIGGIFEPYCDKIIVVSAEHKLAMSRIILRDGISKVSAAKRLAAQLPEQDFFDAADFVIENNTTMQALYQQADIVLQNLLHQATQNT